MSYRKLRDGRIRFVWSGSEAGTIFLVGDFNQWNESSHRMRRTDGRDFELEMEIPPGKYRFKYLVDGVWWNDPEAEEYAPNPWGSEDSVIRIE